MVKFMRCAGMGIICQRREHTGELLCFPHHFFPFQLKQFREKGGDNRYNRINVLPLSLESLT